MNTRKTTSIIFERLVSVLKQSKKTVTVVEQCCGGVINSNILAQPGASAVYYGGTISYSSSRTKPLLLNDDDLHNRLLSIKNNNNNTNSEETTEGEIYRRSKWDWVGEISVAYVKAMDVDYCIVESGASGPTFRPDDITTGFAVVCIAGRDPKSGRVRVLARREINSPHANRKANMELFARKAAELAIQVITDKEEEDHLLEYNNNNDNNLIDRLTHLRSDDEKLNELIFNNEKTRFVILRKENEILTKSLTEIALLKREEIEETINNKEFTFLGKINNNEGENGTTLFSVNLQEEDTKKVEKDDTTILIDNNNSDDQSSSLSFRNTRTTAPLFSPLHNEIALQATAYAQWQRRSMYCSICGGGPMLLIDGGTCRQCPQCRTKSWPRQDPSMITVIQSRCGNKILLANSARHPPKLYTVLAGFVEAGETFESCVARETLEETGVYIDVDSVQYVASQPWPFPQSSMIGFAATADAENQPIRIDPKELVSAAWFDRDQIERASRIEGPTMQKEVARAAFENDPKLDIVIPPKGVIARKLIDGWLEGRFS